MAKIEKRAYADPLLRKDSRGVFNLYRNRNEIGDELIKSFMNYELNKNSEVFLLREGEKETGVITQCYGLLTLLEYAKFKIDIAKYDEAIERINKAFNYVLDKVIAEDGTLIFDASPYVSNTFITKYIETATLFLRVLIEMRAILYDDYKKSSNTIVINEKFVERKEGNPEQENTLKEIKFVESLLVKTIDFITDSALLANGEEGIDYCLNGSDILLQDADGSNIKYKGWTFTTIPEDKHSKTEMSLYHTYLVGEAYLAFYEFFPTSIDLIRKLRDAIYKKYREEGKVTESGKVDLSLDEMVHLIATVDASEFGIKIGIDEVELERDFMFLRSIYKTYHLFNKTILDAGRYVDMQFGKIDTTKDFFNYNFKRVTSEDIENSSASDAMFNVLLAINIIMAAGIDLDYASNGLKDEYYDKLQYSIPNVQRFYKQLIRAGKGDMYDQYILKLNTAISNDDQDVEDSPFNQAKLLRKQHIILLNLLPLIIKTYCTVSKYTIPYPQYDMRSYKDEILKKKMENEWLWDDEEYNLINNYNYVYALRAFYDYYETYERPYSLDRAKYIEEKETEIEKLKEELKDGKEVIKSLKEERQKTLLQHDEEKKEIFAMHDAAMKAEQLRYDEKKAPIELEIENLIGKGMHASVSAILKDILNGIIQQNGRPVNEDDDIRTTLKRAITSYLSGAFSITTELFDESENVDEAMGQALVDEAIKDLVEKQLRSNKQ